MSHKHPELEAELRRVAVNFTAGNIPIDALAAALTRIAEEARKQAVESTVAATTTRTPR